MSQEPSSSEQELEDSGVDFVEVDPTGRYGRYSEVLGRGSCKKVYRAFDEWEGIEVAWNQVKVADLLRDSVDLERLYSEVHLLKTLKHKNIIKFYGSWVDSKNENINFITEIFTSGNLRQYRKKHKHVDLRALKKWSRQILEGLLYLHSHDPPVVHRDLKCDNIFVNGNQGELKIGDLGFAAILKQARSAYSVIGTPEFMAPELYEEEYNELVDIYAFGMCLLELVTFEYPYVECTNPAQIFKKVTSGIKPASLAKVSNPEVKEFIEKCIVKVSDRLSARELLMDPFLCPADEIESVGHSLRPPPNPSGGSHDQVDFNRNAQESSTEPSRGFTAQGQRIDINKIFLKLRIADSTGHVRNIHFPFDIEVDTAIDVAREMVVELDLSDQDVSTIAEMIDSEIQSHISHWKSDNLSADNTGEDVEDIAIHASEIYGASPFTNESTNSSGSLAFERLPSGRRYWSDSPKAIGGSSSLLYHTHSNLSFHVSTLGVHIDGDSPEVPGSPEWLEAESLYNNNNNSNDKEGSWSKDLGFGRSSASMNQVTDNAANKLGDIESDMKKIAERLENMLIQHQRELDELKRKHKLATLDLLNQVPPEAHHKILDMCKVKVADYKM